MSFVQEFKAFAMRGNVIDLAVGVVIGGAFGKIVSVLVDSIIMPVVGVITGGVNFSTLGLKIATDGKGQDVMLKYGAFIQAVVDFLIIAFVVFVAIRAINKMMEASKLSAAEAAPEAPAAPEKTQSEVLLEEIRDLLKAK